MESFIKSIEYEIKQDSNEQYHSKKEYLSASSLKKLKKSPAHFMYEETTETPELNFGSAYHTYVLEKNKFDLEYHVLDESVILEILISEGSKKPRSTNKYKEWYMEQENMANGKKIIELDSFRLIERMSKILRNHRYANSLFSSGVSEISVYCEAVLNDGRKVKLKIRPDYKKDNKRIVSDLKSAVDCSYDGFQKACVKYDYHIQSALYSDICSLIEGNEMLWNFIFIAQEKKKPFAFNIFQPTPAFIAQGRYEYELLILLYLQCIEENKWPGYQVFCENKFGVFDLDLPPYGIKELDFYNHKF